jgi:predicted nucleic acid-binding protein
MSAELRVVFDNNALVSALLFDQSVPARAFFAALDQGIILLSQATFTELSEVLGRSKFDRYVTHEE